MMWTAKNHISTLGAMCVKACKTVSRSIFHYFSSCFPLLCYIMKGFDYVPTLHSFLCLEYRNDSLPDRGPSICCVDLNASVEVRRVTRMMMMIIIFENV